MKGRIVFLTHGSKQLGMGHVMRCMSLGRAFRQKGWKVSFYSKYYLGGTFLKKEGFPVEMQEMEESKENPDNFSFGTKEEQIEDLQWLIPLLQRDRPDVLFVDSYNVSVSFFSELKKYVGCLMYLDDLAAWDYPVDILLNPNIDAGKKGYETFHNPKVFFTGSTYCLLREEFLNPPKRQVAEKVEHIMITTGAADPKNMTETLLKWGEKYWKEAVFHLVIGAAFPNRQMWRELENSKVKLHFSPKRMSDIMLQCDLAISAGGSTLYELAACGVPTIAFLYSENQRGVVETMDEMGYLKNLGWYEELQKNLGKEQEESLWVRQWNKREKREEMVLQQQQLFDGNGAVRVVEAVEKFFDGKMT